MLMKCLSCKNELTNDELFCPYCGKKVDDKTEAIIPSEDELNRTDSFDEIVCNHCGERVSEDAAFCKFCGNAVGNDFTNIQKCRFCNYEIKSVESVFCNNCGKRIISISDIQEKEYKKESDKKDLIPYILLLLAVIVCCAGIITYVYNKTNTEYYTDMPKISSEQKEHDYQNKSSDKTLNEIEISQNEEKILPPEFETVNATSILSSDGQNTYYAENIWDGNKNTAWVEGVSGNGIGEIISFSAASEQSISGIRILNGYCKKEALYWANSRVKKLKITFENDENMIVDIPDAFNQCHDIKFEKIMSSSILKLEIMEIYQGTHYTDTCVSEVEIY